MNYNYDKLCRVRGTEPCEGDWYGFNSTTDKGVEWIWPVGDTATFGLILRDWEEQHYENILKYVPVRDVVVQLGGNMGMYPRFLSDMFRTVYTFEPDPLNFYCLSRNCQEDNIIKIQAALGAEPGLISINRIEPRNLGMNQVIEHPASAIPQLVLDNFALKSLNLLMLDVEHYELEVLKGAAYTISQHHPVIFAENHRPAEDVSVAKFLEEFGYQHVGASANDQIYIVPTP